MDILVSPKTAYLAGAIIGDGHLSNSVKSRRCDPSPDYRIRLDLSDRSFLLHIFSLFKSLVHTSTTPKKSKVRPGRKPRWSINLRNKRLFLFFNEIMEIPRGKKSHIAVVPKVILHGSPELKKKFLAGYFDADGGLRRRSIGFTTASRSLNDDVSHLLHSFNIGHDKESWFNQKYSRPYYGLVVDQDCTNRFLNIFPLQNFEKLERIYSRLMRGCRSGQTGQILGVQA